jgi:tetratricopeptide (TPR) repeat protein
VTNHQSSLVKRLGEAFAVTIVVLLGGLATALQYWHLSNELSAAVAFALSVVVGALTLWLRRPRPSPEDVAQTLRIRALAIDPKASLEVLEDLGVSPTPELKDVSTTAARPPYVEREVDQRIRAALRQNHQFILLIGRSGDGKSRAMFEALASEFPKHTMVVPPRPSSDHDSLKRIAAATFRIEPKDKPAFVWLDDVDEYLDAGTLDRTSLADLLHRKSPRLRLVATIRNEQFLARMQPTESAIDAEAPSVSAASGDATHLLERAEQILFPSEWLPDEIDAARRTYPTVEIDPRVGLGGQLVGGPQLARLLSLAASTNPAGLAVALAAIDARRAGALRPLKQSELQELWTIYLPPHLDVPSTKAFEDALAWACRPTRGGVSAVSPTKGGYVAIDYAVALRSGERPGGPVETTIRAELWDALIRLLNPDDLLAVGFTAQSNGAFNSAEAAWNKSLAAQDPLIRARSLYNIGGVRLSHLSRPIEAVQCYDALISEFGDSADAELREPAMAALLNRAVALGRSGDNAGEIAAYDAIVTRFDATPEPAFRASDSFRASVSGALFNKGLYLYRAGDLISANAAFDSVIDRFADAPGGLVRANVAISTYMKSTAIAGNDEALAIELYNEVITKYGRETEPAIKRVVALALRGKGSALSLSDPVAAIAAFDDVISRFAKEDDLNLRVQVAQALGDKAETLHQEAVLSSISGGGHASPAPMRADVAAVYDEMVERFGSATEPELLSIVAGGLIAKGLSSAGDPAAEIEAYNDVIRRFDTRPEPAIKTQVALALRNLGNVFKLTDPATAIAKYDEVVDRFADASEVELRVAAANALSDKALVQRRNDAGAAVTTYDEIVTRFGTAAEVELWRVVAHALLEKGALLFEDDAPGAIAAYDQILTRVSEPDEPELHGLLALAMYSKGIVLDHNDAPAALTAFESVVARYGDDSQDDVQPVVAMALRGKGDFLASREPAAAVDAYDEVVRRFGDRDHAALREEVARALLEKGDTLRATDVDAAKAAYDEVVSRFGDDAEAELRNLVAAAFVHKGEALQDIDSAASNAAYRAVLERYGDDDEPGLQESVALARKSTSV